MLNSLVIGPGAIGSLTACFSQRLGNVYYYHPDPGYQPPSKLFHKQAIKLNWSAYTGAENIDLIWVCCKAYDVMQAAPRFIEKHHEARVIVMINGMGPQQALKQQFGTRVWLASTTTGAKRVSTHQVRVTGLGTTLIEASALAQPEFSQAVADAQRHEEFDALQLEGTGSIDTALWRKLLINVGINYITAANQINNGELTRPNFLSDVEKIIEEFTQAANDLKISLPADPLNTVLSVATNTAANRSSMAQDIALKRKTENEYLIGYILSLAELKNYKLPTLTYWYQRVKALEDNQTDESNIVNDA